MGEINLKAEQAAEAERILDVAKEAAGVEIR